jgi:hypothetical protein
MQNYSFIQRTFHNFVLNNKLINMTIYEFEKLIFLKRTNINKNSHIFISSLPRSGTTSLLNFIYSSNLYASLTYRHMPFVLSPNLSKFFNKKNVKKKERLHNDGIFYDTYSPEAFDEIFFNNNADFVKEELENYIELILSSVKKKRYLSKNNLNFKRIKLINSILPNAKFLIPIRDPIQHANSLYNQHLHFSKLQKQDDFIRIYMNYLGHNEFGLNHKPWNNPKVFYNSFTLNYWLEQWCQFYEGILSKYYVNENCYFIVYEQLTNKNYLKKLLKKIDLKQIKNLDLDFFKISSKNTKNLKYDDAIYLKAKKIYRDFSNFNIL